MPKHAGEHAGDHAVAIEERDVRVRPVLGVVAGLLVLMCVVAVVVAGLYYWFLAWEGGTRRLDEIPPPAPIDDELRQVRQRERELLGSYAWISRDQGIVRIPIERAMELALQDARNGEPAREQNGEPAGDRNEKATRQEEPDQ